MCWDSGASSLLPLSFGGIVIDVVLSLVLNDGALIFCELTFDCLLVEIIISAPIVSRFGRRHHLQQYSLINVPSKV